MGKNTYKKSMLLMIFILITVSLGIMINGHEIGKHCTKEETQKNSCLKESPYISAETAILKDAETGEVIFEKNADKRAYPASTTKIMTSLIVIETLEQLESPLDQYVSIPERAAGTEGSSIYLEAGEKIKIIDLLYGLMLRSGNDAAEALADIIGSCREDFVDMMNKRAEEIGCKNTNFTNPSGLFEKEHYTTARDMAAISAEAMKNPVFREIVSKEEHTAERENGKYCLFYNKNKTVHDYKGGNGIKIGYTKRSGRTLCASASRSGRTLICVVMNAPDWFNDAYRLMDSGFEYLDKYR